MLRVFLEEFARVNKDMNGVRESRRPQLKLKFVGTRLASQHM
jgi:hypothetical protein